MHNKRFLAIILLLIGAINMSFAQKNSYGINAGISGGTIVGSSSDGGAGYDLKNGFSIGVQYDRKLNRKLHLMTGVSWYKNKVDITPSYDPSLSANRYDIQLISIPAMLRVDLSKIMYLHGGLIGDIDIAKNENMTDQSGLGMGLGMGAELPVANRFAIQINPYVDFHGLLLSGSDNPNTCMLDAGIRVAFVFKQP